MHITCMSCNMHVACMENIPNPCVLHETCMLHACRYICKWNMHVTCTKVNACYHLNYACNMHITCTKYICNEKIYRRIPRLRPLYSSSCKGSFVSHISPPFLTVDRVHKPVSKLAICVILCLPYMKSYACNMHVDPNMPVT